MSDTNTNNGGIGLLGAVFLVFLVLKLTDQIDWSWWWITAPIWIPVALVLGLAIVAGLVSGIVKGVKDAKTKKAIEARRKALRDRGRS